MLAVLVHAVPRDLGNRRRRRRRRAVHPARRRRGDSPGRIIGGRGQPDTISTLFIVIGIAAFLGAGYRVPLAAVMFVAETTGRPSFVVPGLLAAVAAELMMGNSIGHHLPTCGPHARAGITATRRP